VIKILCKLDEIDVAYSEKTLECLCSYIDDDVDFVDDTALPIKKQLSNMRVMKEKYDLLLSGEEVNFEGWRCIMEEVDVVLHKPTQFFQTGSYLTGALCPACKSQQLEMSDKYCRHCGAPIDIEYNKEQFDKVLEREKKKRGKQDVNK